MSIEQQEHEAISESRLPRIINVLVAIVLFFGGIFLMGFAFSQEQYQGVWFVAGLLTSVGGLALAIHRRDA